MKTNGRVAGVTTKKKGRRDIRRPRFRSPLALEAAAERKRWLGMIDKATRARAGDGPGE